MQPGLDEVRASKWDMEEAAEALNVPHFSLRQLSSTSKKMTLVSKFSTVLI